MLGPAAKCIRAGVVVAAPGASLQGIHRDGRQLFGDGELDDCGVAGAPLPAHCLTVFVPLLALRDCHGPTEFFPGTHVLPDAVDARVSASTGKGVTFPVAAGSAIMFDYRVHHRGLANTSGEDRPLLYFTYARSWFEDVTNYGSTVSIFDFDSVPKTKPDPTLTRAVAKSDGARGSSSDDDLDVD